MRPLYVVLGTALTIACAQPEPTPEPSAAPGELVFVTNEDSGDLTVIATSTHEVIATIPVGKRPRGVRLSKDGRTAYVALSGSPKCPPWMSDEDCAAQVTDKTLDGVAVVDVAAGRVTKVLPGGSDPEQFDLSLDGKQICVAKEEHGGEHVSPDAGQRGKNGRVGAMLVGQCLHALEPLLEMLVGGTTMLSNEE